MTAQLNLHLKAATSQYRAPIGKGQLQRKCACGGKPGVTGECEECQKKRLSLQRKSRNSEVRSRNHSYVPPIVHEVLRSPGHPLDADTRAFMEPRFGHDFSQVRLHTNAKAAESAQAVKALAYAVGSDVAFGAGRYAPQTRAGRRLLAHELAHVVQQAQADQASRVLQRAAADAEIGASETEARQAEQAVASSEGGDTQRVEPSVPPETTEQPEQTLGTAACPVTAIFSSTVAGPQKAGCLVAPGMFGASKLAHFRIVGASPGANITISEQFTPVEDPYSTIGLIPRATYTTTDGAFDDCYKLESKNLLPPDFILKVEQNHLFNGQIISKNQITFRADSVGFCHFDRLPGTCDFGARCKL
jgi:hypothetical protein